MWLQTTLKSTQWRIENVRTVVASKTEMQRARIIYEEVSLCIIIVSAVSRLDVFPISQLFLIKWLIASLYWELHNQCRKTVTLRWFILPFPVKELVGN